MRTRKQIEKLIEAKKKKINTINDEIGSLIIESIKLVHNNVRYEEKEEEWTVSKRPKKTELHKIGRIHWIESFCDEDSGEIINWNTSRVVRKDGIWLI